MKIHHRKFLICVLIFLSAPTAAEIVNGQPEQDCPLDISIKRFRNSRNLSSPECTEDCRNSLNFFYSSPGDECGPEKLKTLLNELITTFQEGSDWPEELQDSSMYGATSIAARLDPQTQEFFAEHLFAEVARDNSTALRCLFRLPKLSAKTHERIQAELLRILEDDSEDRSMRFEAAWDANLYGENGIFALPGLMDIVEGEKVDPLTRSHAIYSYGSLGAALTWSGRIDREFTQMIVATLIQNLTDDDEDVRWRATQSIGYFRHDAVAAVPTLIARLDSSELGPVEESETVRREIIYALRLIGGKDADRIGIPMEGYRATEDPQVRRNIVLALRENIVDPQDRENYKNRISDEVYLTLSQQYYDLAGLFLDEMLKFAGKGYGLDNALVGIGLRSNAKNRALIASAFRERLNDKSIDDYNRQRVSELLKILEG